MENACKHAKKWEEERKMWLILLRLRAWHGYQIRCVLSPVGSTTFQQAPLRVNIHSNGFNHAHPSVVYRWKKLAELGWTNDLFCICIVGHLWLLLALAYTESWKWRQSLRTDNFQQEFGNHVNTSNIINFHFRLIHSCGINFMLNVYQNKLLIDL